MAKPQLTPDKFLDDFDNWDGTIGSLSTVVDGLKHKYGEHKVIILDAGHNNVSFVLDNSDVRAREQAEWDKKHLKKLSASELQEHKNKVIITLLEHAGVKLSKKEINERITTGRGFDDLLNK